MPYLSAESIEAIARRVITAYRKLPSLEGQEIRMVQPELLVRDLLGLSVEHHVLSITGGILGLTACGEVGVPIYDDPNRPEYFILDGKTLLIDRYLTEENANKGRYHFTLVHEACHQIFRMLFPKEYQSQAMRRKIHCCRCPPAIADDRWEEWRTNRLTSSVLMPEDMVRSNLDAFGLGGRQWMLNRVFASDDYDRFSAMADFMGVSKMALAIRLKRLGLLEKEYLRDPYELIAVYVDDDYDDE